MWCGRKYLLSLASEMETNIDYRQGDLRVNCLLPYVYELELILIDACCYA